MEREALGAEREIQKRKRWEKASRRVVHATLPRRKEHNLSACRDVKPTTSSFCAKPTTFRPANFWVQKRRTDARKIRRIPFSTPLKFKPSPSVSHCHRLAQAQHMITELVYLIQVTSVRTHKFSTVVNFPSTYLVSTRVPFAFTRDLIFLLLQPLNSHVKSS